MCGEQGGHQWGPPWIFLISGFYPEVLIAGSFGGRGH